MYGTHTHARRDSITSMCAQVLAPFAIPTSTLPPYPKSRFRHFRNTHPTPALRCVSNPSLLSLHCVCALGRSPFGRAKDKFPPIPLPYPKSRFGHFRNTHPTPALRSISPHPPTARAVDTVLQPPCPNRTPSIASHERRNLLRNTFWATQTTRTPPLSRR